MKVHYLEIVASDVDAVCVAYEAALGVTDSEEPHRSPVLYIQAGVNHGLWQP